MDIQKLAKNKPLSTIILSTVVFLVIYLFSFGDIFYSLDRKIQNSYYSVKNDVNQSKINKDIYVIEIDDNTLKESGLGRFPFDRQAYIPIIENLNSVGAGIIAFDIIFAEETNSKSDEAFAKAIKDAGNVIIGSFFSRDGLFNKSFYYDEIKASGFLSPKIDSTNGVVYSIIPYLKSADGIFVNNFGITILKEYYSKLFKQDFHSMKPKVENGYYYVTDNIKVPLTGVRDNEILINYSRYGDYKSEKRVLSFLDIYDKERFEENKRYYDFKDKIFIVGATATGIKDIFYTPNGMEYGVYTHANLINTVLNKDFRIYFDKKVEFLLIYLLIIISVYFNLSKKGSTLILSNIGVFSIFVVVYPLVITAFSGVIISYPFEIFFALVLSLIVSNIYKYLLEDRNKSVLAKALGEYVSPQVANIILNGGGDVNLDGDKKRISIFFSDIAGFTTISEKMTPERLVLFLREYLGTMSSLIINDNGLIDKYEGDAIMALWGVFGYENSSSYDNCRAALEQQKELDKLNVRWKEEYGEELHVRMGLHTGEAIVGNMGAVGKKMEFTALGDSVNLASRLEGVNKFYGTYICASEEVKREVEDKFEFRYLDKIKVKGKTQPIGIYELIGYKGQVSESKLDFIKEFEGALDLYFAGDFDKAKDIFSKLSKTDKTSEIFSKRCDSLSVKYEVEIPRENWDGVWEMTEK